MTPPGTSVEDSRGVPVGQNPAPGARSPRARTWLPGAGRSFPRPVRLLLVAEAVLTVLVAAALLATWLRIPQEGAKLHGNIDVGIDLLGGRRDLLWIGLTAAAIMLGNSALAIWLRERDPAAMYFLLGSSIVVLLGLLGALVFIASLNPRT